MENLNSIRLVQGAGLLLVPSDLDLHDKGNLA
jgi:hypothetical protein